MWSTSTYGTDGRLFRAMVVHRFSGVLSSHYFFLFPISYKILPGCRFVKYNYLFHCVFCLKCGNWRQHMLIASSPSAGWLGGKKQSISELSWIQQGQTVSSKRAQCEELQTWARRWVEPCCDEGYARTALCCTPPAGPKLPQPEQ